jgi:glutamate racemase
VRRVLPEHDVLFFADQAHVPYGGRPQVELLRLLAANVAYLERAGAHVIIAGCNTSCAVAEIAGWPATGLPVLDLIESAALAVAASGAQRVGVVATVATVASGAYPRMISTFAPGVEVEQVAAPALVPLVEAGEAGSLQARAAVAQVLSRFTARFHALVLGCSHYLFLAPHFSSLLGDVPLIDPAVEQAARAARLVAGHEFPAENGRTRFVTNAERGPFLAGIEALLGPLDDMEDVQEDRDGEPSERGSGEHLRERMGA